MHAELRKRCIKNANLILDNNWTLRQVAQHAYISKSTVHKDLTERLLKIDKELHERVRVHLDHNLQERNSRGGQALKAIFDRRKKGSVEIV